MDSYHVILVVDREFGARLRELPEGTPAWIVDSVGNYPAIAADREERKKKNHQTGLTSFRDCLQLSSAGLAASMIATIDEHHGVHSCQPSFSRLTVIGAGLDSTLAASLEEIGFHFVYARDSALDFAKNEVPNAEGWSATSSPPAALQRDPPR